MNHPSHVINPRHIDFEVADNGTIELFNITNPTDAVWVSTRVEAISWVNYCIDQAADFFYPHSMIELLENL